VEAKKTSITNAAFKDAIEFSVPLWTLRVRSLPRASPRVEWAVAFLLKRSAIRDPRSEIETPFTTYYLQLTDHHA